MSEKSNIADLYEEQVDAKRAAELNLKKMRALEEKFKPRMKTIVLKDGTIISSTNEEHLKYFLEQDKRNLKIGY
jgi:DNA replication protein DnaD